MFFSLNTCTSLYWYDAQKHYECRSSGSSRWPALDVVSGSNAVPERQLQQEEEEDLDEGGRHAQKQDFGSWASARQEHGGGNASLWSISGFV